MDADEFRRRGKEMIDYVADYLENIRDRRPLPAIQPGYIRELIPDHAPEEAEKWEDVFSDIERVIMPGVTHWQHPNFHAYYPSRNSYPAILADLLSDSIGSVAFTWASNPACTELEVVMMDWLGKMLDLPEEFLFTSGGPGCGVIQGSASEATLVSLLSARVREIHKYKQEYPATEDCVVISKLVAYCSDQSHSSVDRAGRIACVRMRALETDEDAALQGNALQTAIEEDRAKGLIPIFVCATLGTTSSCAFDNVLELGKICHREGLWMHIDAAYAGSAFICPEFRPLLNGVEYAESFNFNPHKWLQVTFDCSAMWVKDSRLITEAFKHDSVILKHENEGKMPDYYVQLAHTSWYPVSITEAVVCASDVWKERFTGEIRKDINLAKEFEKLVKSNSRFEIIGKVTMGLVCFRVKASNEINEKLLKAVNDDRRIHIVPSKIKDKFFLRFAVCATRTNSSDVALAWKVVQELTEKLM